MLEWGSLPVVPPVAPMLSKAGPLPTGDGWAYEPKWDGFRTIVFRSGDRIELGSRNEKPMTRYFPEVVEALKGALPEQCVVDGEIIIVRDERLDFDGLQNRIHPAASRVKLLAEQTPARFVAFDLLAVGDRDLRREPYTLRRALLAEHLTETASVRLTPATNDRSVAEDWFDRFEGIGCDGIIAKRHRDPYTEDKRVMVKVKHQRTADCVVAGLRWHKSGPIVGSLLLGLWADGQLHHVGITASFTMARRAELVDELAPWRLADGDDHPWSGWLSWAEEAAASGQRLPGGQSRWNAKKDLSFVALRPDRACEVGYDHLQGNRFRHATTFVRWRDDRTATSCTYEQLEVPVLGSITELLG